MDSPGDVAHSPVRPVDERVWVTGSQMILADADARSCRARVSALTEAGFTVFAVGQASAALAAMLEHPPVVALISDNLPDVKSVELCRLIKANPAVAGIPLLLITGVDDGAALSGADAWIRTAASPKELVAYARILARLSWVERHCRALEQRSPPDVADLAPTLLPQCRRPDGIEGDVRYCGNVRRPVTDPVSATHPGNVPLFPSLQFWQLVDLVPESIGVNHDNQLVFVNQAFLVLVGADDAGQVLGRSALAFIPTDDRARVREQLRRVVDEGRSVPALEERFVRLDGTEVLVEVAAAPCDTERGRAVLVFVRDITRRKQFEEALRLRERELSLIMDSAPAPIAYVDANGRYRRVNKSYQRQFGVAPDDVQGRHVREVVGEAAWQVVEPYMQRALAGEPIAFETEVPYSRGGTRWMAATYTPDRDEAGLVRGLVAQVVDISQHKAAEAKLWESEQRFRQIAQTISHVFWMTELDPERVVYVSPAFRGIWGRAPEELYANPRLWVEAIHPEDRQRVEQTFDLWTRELLGREYHIEFRIVRPDGEQRWINDRGTLLKNAAGEVERIAGIAEDITARKLIEDALQERTERFQLVIAGAHAAIWDWDVLARRVFFSPQWKALRGFADGEVGDHEDEFISRIHPDDAPRVLAAIQAHFDGGTAVFAEEYRTRCRDGSWTWIIDRGIAQRDSGGRVVRMAGSQSDIAEQKRLEQALRDSEQFKQGVLDSLPAHIAVLDTAGIILAVNEPWRRFVRDNGCGRPDEYEVGANYLETCRRMSLTGDLLAWEAPEGIESVLRGDRTRFELEYPCHSPDQERWFLMHVLRSAMDTGGVLVTQMDITSQKRVEQALRETQADLEQAQVIGQIGSWRLDLVRNRLTWSEENHRIFGIASGTPMTYEIFLGLVHPDDRNFVNRKWADALHGHCYDIEHRIVVDGQVKWVRERAELEFNAEGGLSGAFGTTQDITPLKRAEEALRISETRFRAMIQAVPSLTFEGDPAGNNTFASESWCSFTGMTVLETAGRGWARAVHPEDRPAVAQRWTESMLTGVLYESKYRLRGVDGAYRWFIARALPIRNAEGVIERWAGSLTDIDDLVRSEAALREREAHIRQLLEALPQLVWTGGADGACDFLSPQWLRFTGQDEASQLGRGWLRQVYPTDRGRITQRWREVTAGKAMFEAELRIRRADGVYHWFQCRAVPLRDEGGGIVKWLGTGSDIEDLKRADQALRNADRRKDEFLAMLSHELRNPLAPIRSAAVVLRALDPSDPRLQSMRDIIARQVDHMTLLIDDLLDLSRITRGQIALKKDFVAIADVVEQTVEASRPTLDARRHRLTVDLPDEPVYLEGDLVRLVQVVTNLLRNAAKYTDEQGAIRLAVECEKSHVVLRISDNGIGIPADLMPSLFDVFAQGPRTLDRSEGGLGIGLSLAKRLVEMHGGTIGAHSRGTGQGSEFTVRLPRLVTRALSAPVQAIAAHSVPGPAAGTQRILVVDDNRDAAETLSMLLTLEGHEVRQAYDASSAIEVARTFRPQLIMLDIGLPEMDGFEVANVLRQFPETRDANLIAITGYAEPEILRRSREAGFRRHLVKPVAVADLLAAILSV